MQTRQQRLHLNISTEQALQLGGNHLIYLSLNLLVYKMEIIVLLQGLSGILQDEPHKPLCPVPIIQYSDH